jgi:hypothetical protein
MHWQDWIFSLGQIIFLIALVPTLKGKSKPELLTSIVTSAILVIFALTYFSLGLWFSAASSVAMTIAWAALAKQKYSQTKK